MKDNATRPRISKTEATADEKFLAGPKTGPTISGDYRHPLAEACRYLRLRRRVYVTNAMSLYKRISLYVLLLAGPVLLAQQDRWTISGPGTITWAPAENEAHSDHIEMSGRYISAVIRYGVEADGDLRLSRTIVWPMLRTIPNNTHASLTRTFSIDPVALMSIDRRPVTKEMVSEFQLDGTLTIRSTLLGGFSLVRTLFPSTDKPALCEKYVLRNQGAKTAVVEVPDIRQTIRTLQAEGVDGAYRLTAVTQYHGAYTVPPGDSVVFYLHILGEKSNERPDLPEGQEELYKRRRLLTEWRQNLVLEAPDEVINTAFAFAKIRAHESIYATKGGPMHGPGGLSYYAAIWANDQAEYINPYFPFSGYAYGDSSAVNAFRHFARYMNPDYRPIPSSIIAEGTDYWNGAGDRGDAAMIAYGAGRFALAAGDRTIASELWPLIEWCLEFCRRKLTADGVVASDSDELEGRFPAGTANLCTSSLYYDALLSAAWLSASLGKDKKLAANYRKQAKALAANIEKYFGANVAGFDTYRYYAGNETLRAWICIPLTVGLYDRKSATIDALFSPQLWTPDGLATEAGDSVFWDRSTLYALRGVFAAGETARGLHNLRHYARRRLLGDHVPYPVEAWPEGGQRHLSAESGLFCRIFTEGLFGIRPVALNAFDMTPRLPAGWPVMKLRQVHGFGTTFDIEVRREGVKIRAIVTAGKTTVTDQVVQEGDVIRIQFPAN